MRFKLFAFIFGSFLAIAVFFSNCSKYKSGHSSGAIGWIKGSTSVDTSADDQNGENSENSNQNSNTSPDQVGTPLPGNYNPFETPSSAGNQSNGNAGSPSNPGSGTSGGTDSGTNTGGGGEQESGIDLSRTELVMTYVGSNGVLKRERVRSSQKLNLTLLEGQVLSARLLLDTYDSSISCNLKISNGSEGDCSSFFTSVMLGADRHNSSTEAEIVYTFTIKSGNNTVVRKVGLISQPAPSNLPDFYLKMILNSRNSAGNITNSISLNDVTSTSEFLYPSNQGVEMVLNSCERLGADGSCANRDHFSQYSCRLFDIKNIDYLPENTNIAYQMGEDCSGFVNAEDSNKTYYLNDSIIKSAYIITVKGPSGQVRSLGVIFTPNR